MPRPALSWRMAKRAKALTKRSQHDQAGQGETPMLNVDQARAAAQESDGSPINCTGCGETGIVFWESQFSRRVLAARIPRRLKGNFYLHGDKIACGRCQQIYRPE